MGWLRLPPLYVVNGAAPGCAVFWHLRSVTRIFGNFKFKVWGKVAMLISTWSELTAVIWTAHVLFRRNRECIPKRHKSLKTWTKSPKCSNLQTGMSNPWRCSTISLHLSFVQVWRWSFNEHRDRQKSTQGSVECSKPYSAISYSITQISWALWTWMQQICQPTQTGVTFVLNTKKRRENMTNTPKINKEDVHIFLYLFFKSHCSFFFCCYFTTLLLSVYTKNNTGRPTSMWHGLRLMICDFRPKITAYLHCCANEW